MKTGSRCAEGMRLRRSADAHSWLRTSVPRQRRRFAAEHAFGQVDQEDLLFAEDLRKLEARAGLAEHAAQLQSK